MKKPILPVKYWYLGLYIGQEIEHYKHGRYFLDGFYSKGVFCVRNLTDDPEQEECELFPFNEVKLVLKPVNESIIKRYGEWIVWIRNKCGAGYWVFSQSEFGKSIILKKEDET